MSIPTQASVHGFIATAPELNFTGSGVARFHARAGVEQFRKEVDGSFTKLDSTFHDLVMFGKAAERAYARFKVGDQFLASGYVHEFEVEKTGGSEIREQFVARRIGHDCARTRYSVDRTPPRQPDPPAGQISSVNQPAQVAGP
jgi:single-strand DNA-binding protein